MQTATNLDAEQATVRLLRALVGMLTLSRPGAGSSRRIRACLCGLLGNLAETLDRREDAQLLQCHVRVRDAQRHWRIQVCLVPSRFAGRTILRVRTLAENLRPR